MRTTRAVLSPLIGTALVLAGSGPNAAQELVSPNASLELHVTAAPVPVRVAARTHLVYELHITNFRSVDLTLTRIDVFGGEDDDVRLASYQDAELDARLARAGSRPDSSDPRVIGSGMRAVFFAWLTLDDAKPVPSTLHHRVSFAAFRPQGNETGVVEGGRTEVRREAPVVLGAPLRGGPWVAVYDPTLVAGHRRSLYAIDGRARIPARFAIDWIRLGDDGRQWRGDPSSFSSWYGYGAEVLAVADAVVVDVSDGLPENLPKTAITFDNAGGNYVTLDLGGSRFAFYEHLQPGSITVKIADRVRSGQVLARLGGSGSVSSGPHLHFHVSDASSPLGAEGLPYVFRSFERLGAFESLEALGSGRPWAARPGEEARTHAMEMPAHQTVLRF